MIISLCKIEIVQMKKIKPITLLLLLHIFVSVNGQSLQKLSPKNWIKNKTENSISFETEKNEAIGGKAGEQIKLYMLSQAQDFKKINGAIVSTLRNGEILKVSIPAKYFFGANDSILLNSSNVILNKILTNDIKNDLMKLIVTAHSDNNGTEKFKTQITQSRSFAVYNWFLQNGINPENIEYYYYGDSQPLFDNDSMSNRDKNRRLTFYFIPTKNMEKLAKKNKLNNTK